MRFDNILAKYRAISFSERDKGDRFERLMQGYLKTDPKYAHLFRDVWLWSSSGGRILGKDTGIDLVALTVDGTIGRCSASALKKVLPSTNQRWIPVDVQPGVRKMKNLRIPGLHTSYGLPLRISGGATHLSDPQPESACYPTQSV